EGEVRIVDRRHVEQRGRIVQQVAVQPSRLPRADHRAGPNYAFERRGDRFVEIANCQGVIQFVKASDGYLGIECTSRCGAERKTRTILRYKENRYKVVDIHGEAA